VERRWTVGPDNSGEADRGRVHQLLADIESIGHKVGGSFVLVPLREKRPDDEGRTVGWTAVWRSFTPAFAPGDPTDDEAAAVLEPDGVAGTA
jgi:hypothetical protein